MREETYKLTAGVPAALRPRARLRARDRRATRAGERAPPARPLVVGAWPAPRARLEPRGRRRDAAQPRRAPPTPTTVEEADELGRRDVLDLDDDESAEGVDVTPGADAERGRRRRAAEPPAPPRPRPRGRGARRRRTTRSSQGAIELVKELVDGRLQPDRLLPLHRRPPTTSPTHLREALPQGRRGRGRSPARSPPTEREAARRTSSASTRSACSSRPTACPRASTSRSTSTRSSTTTWPGTRPATSSAKAASTASASERDTVRVAHLLRRRQPRSTASCSTCCSASTSDPRLARRLGPGPGGLERGARGDPRGPRSLRGRRRSPSSSRCSTSSTEPSDATSFHERVGRAPPSARSARARCSPSTRSRPTRSHASSTRVRDGDRRRRRRRGASSRDALRAHGATVVERHGDAGRVDLAEVPRALRDALGARRRASCDAASSCRSRDGVAVPRAHAPGRRRRSPRTSSTPRSTRYGERVAARCGGDPHATRSSAARRCSSSGFASTSSPGAASDERQLLAEDARLARLRRARPTSAEWLDDAGAPRRCSTPSPTATSRPTRRAQFARARRRRVSPTSRPQLDDVARERARRAARRAPPRARGAAATGVTSRGRAAAARRTCSASTSSCPSPRTEPMQTARREPLHDDPHRRRRCCRPTCSQRIADGDKDLGGLDARRLPPRAGERAQRGDRPLLEPARRRLGALSRGRARSFPRTTPARRLTRERWLLSLFDELGYGRLQTAHGRRDRGQELPGLPRLGSTSPIHLVGCGVAARPPHAGRRRRRRRRARTASCRSS